MLASTVIKLEDFSTYIYKVSQFCIKCKMNLCFFLKYKHTIKTPNKQLINNRIHYRTALQLNTGHIGLNKHLYNMNITKTTKCLACEYEQGTSLFSAQVTHKSGQTTSNFHTYHSNTDDIFSKHSLTRIVGYV